MHVKRKDDLALKNWFRSDRFIRDGDNWYFCTREGTLEGPFEDKLQAVDRLDTYIRVTTLGLIEHQLELARSA